jgi:hypothetical protein
MPNRGVGVGFRSASCPALRPAVHPRDEPFHGLAIRDVFGEQHETPAYLQERQALGRVMHLLAASAQALALLKYWLRVLILSLPPTFIQQTTEQKVGSLTQPHWSPKGRTW